MSNISTLVGLYNNLEYSKNFYQTFRAIYPTEELVFVSYGSNDGTDQWLYNLNDDNLVYQISTKKKTFSDTYNKAAKLATKPFICFAHNDMVVAPGFLENLEKYTHKDRVISYTTVEPPIFSGHERPGKLIADYGNDLITFDKDTFLARAESEQAYFKDKTSDGISFFMCLSREVFLEIGGFDNIFNPYFCEDDDLIRRLKLRGLKCFTSLDSIVYHFVSKTSRFSEEAKLKTQQIERNSNRTYLRKWGSLNSNNRFNITFIVKNLTLEFMEILEPWCDKLYCGENDPIGSILQEYIKKEQLTTHINLEDKIRYIKGFSPLGNNKVNIYFDASKLDNNNFEIIKNLQNILQDTEEGKEYNIDIFNIKTNSLTNYISDLIFIHKK